MTRPAPIAANEYRERARRASRLARERGLDALLVWSAGGATLDAFGDVFYLTNHYSVEPRTHDVPGQWRGFGASCVIVDGDGRTTLLVGPPNWRDDLVVADKVRSNRDLYAACVRALRQLGLADGRIGLVREQLVPLPLYHEIRVQLPGAQLERSDEILESLRVVKSDAEVALMRHASAIGVEVMQALLGEVAEGRTDGDLAARGYARSTELGATPYEFAMASGPDSHHAYWSRLPGFDPRRRYARGDMLHPDVFGCFDGYFYDFQRSTVVGGAPSDDQRRVLEGVVAAVDHICDQLRPGRLVRDVHAAGVAWMRDHGWSQGDGAEQSSDLATFSAFGHGIGLGFEGPWLTADDETTLQPGMTIAVETFCAIPDVATAIHEEDVLVTSGDPEIMTAGCPKSWWER
jgi:Xaa-Pro dipeptidase